MNIEIIRKDNKNTRLTVAKDRITIKPVLEDDNEKTIEFLTKVGKAVAADPNINVTMRGRLDKLGICLYNDSKTFSVKYYFPE